MLNVVDCLECLGGRPSASSAERADIEEGFAAARMEPAVRAALVSGDRKELECLLGIRSNVYRLIAPARQDEGDDIRPKRLCEDDAPAEEAAPVREPTKVAAA
jgi:hypothetical protein